MKIGVLAALLQSLAVHPMTMEKFQRVKPMILGLDKELRALRILEARLLELMAKAR